MSRHIRWMLPGVPVHIVQRGADRQSCFLSDHDSRRYLELVRRHGHACRLHAYVLMTNHVHLLATFDDVGAMSVMMKTLDQEFCQYVNWRYGRSGSLWEGRYKSCLVQDERYLLVCQRYLELNPVRAGLVDYPGQYRWSSYRANAEGKNDVLVRPHELYQRLGADPDSRQRAYRDLVASGIRSRDLEQIRRATAADFAVGDQAFLRRAAAGRRFSGD